MFYRYALFIFIACLVAPLSPLRAHANPLAGVLISEITWGGSPLSTADEWIELTNTSEEAIDISSWSLTGIASQGGIITIPEHTSLAAHATYLIANYAQGDPKTAVTVPVQQATTAVSIANSSLHITLLDAYGTLVDAFADDGTLDVGSSTLHASAERDVVNDTWVTASSSVNLQANSGFGTPGYVILPEPVTSLIREDPSHLHQDYGGQAVDAILPQDDTLVSLENDGEASDMVLAEETVISEETVSEIVSEDVSMLDADTLDPGSPVRAMPEGSVPGMTSDSEVMDDDITSDIVNSEVTNIAEVSLPEDISEDILTVNEYMMDAGSVSDMTSDNVTDAAPETEIILPQDDPVIEPIIVEEIIFVHIDPIIVYETVAASETVEAVGDEEEAVIPSSATETTNTPITITHTTTLDYQPLQITEFLSAPATGEDEWVELWNSGDDDLPLEGLFITDASNKHTPLTGSIAAKSYTVITRPLGKLNNDKDNVHLTLPDGQILFSLSYGTEQFSAPKKTFSAGVCADGWRSHLTPSPGAENICPTHSSSLSPSYETSSSVSSTTTTALDSIDSPSGTSSTVQDTSDTETVDALATPLSTVTASVVTASTVTDSDVSSEKSKEAKATKTSSSSKETSSTAKKTTPSKKDPLAVSIDDLDGVRSDQIVEVEGVIIAEPGMFGKRVAYLNGVQLYFHKAEWPSLPIGTQVHILGTWDNAGDNRRIKIAQAANIRILGTETVTPYVYEELSQESAGDVLVQITGSLTKKEEGIFFFTLARGDILRVIDSLKTGSLATLRVGDSATITGMLLAVDGAWALVPRTRNDIILPQDASPVITETPAQSTSPIETLTAIQPSATKPIVGGGILLSTTSALGYWFFRHKKFSLIPV